ncbi:hypothetical protein ONZ45_g9151 [Pleurotus djamor]|nr:hypothetical protein ONZ45_g9151 [Pleurotus djamor]
MPHPEASSDLDDLVSSYYNTRSNFDDGEAKSIISLSAHNENEDMDLYDLYGDHEDDEHPNSLSVRRGYSRSASPMFDQRLEGGSGTSNGSTATKTIKAKVGDKGRSRGPSPAPSKGHAAQGRSEAKSNGRGAFTHSPTTPD